MPIAMSLWIYLMLTAISASLLIFLLLRPKRKEISRALKLGTILMAIDFVFEHVGVLAGWWSISKSALFLGVVPFEVVVIAFCTGFAYALLFKQKFDVFFAVVSSSLIGLVGVGIEALLIAEGLLGYTAITSWHALLAYIVVFIVLNKINSTL